jgi:hypothetical protein
VALPPFTDTGDLPAGIHAVSLRELVAQLVVGTPQRRAVATRLERVHELATATGAVGRFFVFGSFVTAKPEPNDVDVFLLMDDSFDLNTVTGEARLLFDHAAAQAYFGASVFWLRRSSAYPTEQETVAGWQITREGTRRGIVELISEAP